MIRRLLVAVPAAAFLAACGSPSPTPYESGYRKGFGEGYCSAYSDRPGYGGPGDNDRRAYWPGDYGSSRRYGVQPPSDY